MKKHVIGTAALLLLAGMSSPLAQATGTLAGTDITNTATATFDDPDNPLGPKKTVTSNTSTLVVDEVLNVTITSNGGNVSVSPGDSQQVMSFTMTNTGNGPEAFDLDANGALAGNDFNPTTPKIYIDSNGDGIFNPLDDAEYTAGSEPVLDPDESILLFVVSNIPTTRVDGITPVANGDEGNVSLTAEAITAQETVGTDDPGHVFVGSGTNGSDAVVGITKAIGLGDNAFVVSSIQTTFIKESAVVEHPVYKFNLVPGAIVEYTLTLTVTGSGSLSNIEIVDQIPANTTFVNSSIELDTAPLTDVADGDDGELRTGAGINPPREVVVRVPTATAPQTYVVKFKVKID